MRACHLAAAWENAKIQWVKCTAQAFRDKGNPTAAILFRGRGFELAP